MINKLKKIRSYYTIWSNYCAICMAFIAGITVYIGFSNTFEYILMIGVFLMNFYFSLKSCFKAIKAYKLLKIRKEHEFREKVIDRISKCEYCRPRNSKRHIRKYNLDCSLCHTIEERQSLQIIKNS